MIKIIRTILCTTIENNITHEQKEIYGRYDPVTLQRNQYKILSACTRKYEMTDEEFVKHAKEKF